jgi:predicted DNA-binding transcriptional regulator AlpA
MFKPYSEADLLQHATQSPLSDESLIVSRRLRKLLGDCSEMHIWRLLNDEKNQPLAFPKPIKINDRNYWRLGAIRQWVRGREVQSQLASTAALRVAPRSGPTAAPRIGNHRKQIRPSKRARHRRARTSEPPRYLPDEAQHRAVPASVRRRP